MENTIKALFLNFKQKDIDEIAIELQKIAFALDYILISSIEQLSEPNNSKWNTLVVNAVDSGLNFKQFFSLNKQLHIILSTDSPNKDLVQAIFNDSKNDLVSKSNTEIAFSLIRNHQKSKMTLNSNANLFESDNGIKYAQLFENMQEGVGAVDLEENILFSNPAFNRIFGCEMDGMIGANLKDFIYEDDLNTIISETAKRKSNQVSTYNVRIKRKNGSSRLISVSSVPWKNSKNEILGAIGIIMDITEQEYANKRLLKKLNIEHSIINISAQFISSENFNIKLDNTLKELKNIIDAERYGILIVENGRIVLTNEFYNNSSKFGLGFSSVQLNELKYTFSMLDSFDFIFFDHIDNLPKEAAFERELFKKYGIFNFLGIPIFVENRLYGLITVINIFDVDEWSVEDLSMLRTITEIIGHAFSRRKAEEKAIQLNLDLITKNNELEQVVYVTSHDIRSPVVNVLGFSDEMVKALNKLYDKIFDASNQIQNKDEIEFLLKKDIPQIQNFIRISGEKIDKLLLALLKLSRMGRAVINKTNVNMNDLVQSVISNFELLVQQENIQFSIDKLPNCFTDEVVFNQVFFNLIDNSIKYRDKTRNTVISITANELSDQVTYCIADNGIGISETELTKIFNVFYRINPENEKGDGIGLSLIKKILERLNGKVFVESEEGKGTKFYIMLEKQTS